MQKWILAFVVAIIMLAGAAYAADEEGQAICRPGKPGGCSTSPGEPPNLKPHNQPSLKAPRCLLPGIWEDSFGADITVSANLTGTFKLPWCGASHGFKIAQNGDSFTLKASWGGGKECIGFTLNMTFNANSCDFAAGTFLNADGGTGTDSWIRDGIFLYRLDLMTIRAPGYPDNGTGIFLWNPVLVSGQNPPTIDFADSYTLIDNPNEATLKNPVSTGAPTPGGLTKIYGKYSWSTENGNYSSANYILVPTFGMSCYYNTLESDWGDPLTNQCLEAKIAGTYYNGVYTEAWMKKYLNYTGGPFCQTFIRSVILEGAGTTNKGVIIAYDKKKHIIYETTTIPTADGSPAVPGKTVARDKDNKKGHKKIIPQTGVLITLDQFGEVLANDVGDAIIGYRLDLYMGDGKDVCLSGPISHNPIVVGGCYPAQTIGGKVTCPSIY